MDTEYILNRIRILNADKEKIQREMRFLSNELNLISNVENKIKLNKLQIICQENNFHEWENSTFEFIEEDSEKDNTFKEFFKCKNCKLKSVKIINKIFSES